MKLIFPCRSGNTPIRREDPMELQTKSSPERDKWINKLTQLESALMSLVGATAEEQISSMRNRDLALKARATAPANRISDLKDPARPINGPSYPRDNSAIPF